MVPVHEDKFEGNTSMQGANYERDILSAQIVVWVVGFTLVSDVRYALEVDHQEKYNIFCDKINTTVRLQRYF